MLLKRKQSEKGFQKRKKRSLGIKVKSEKKTQRKREKMFLSSLTSLTKKKVKNLIQEFTKK